MKKILLFTLIIFIFVSCASKPQLYPNNKLKSVGKDSAEKDVDQCMAGADDYLKSSKGKNIAKGAGAGAAIGAAMGAVAGMFTGNIGGSALRSGAVGAAGGGVVGGLSPDQVKRNFTNQCLGDKGYQVIGWD